MELLRLAGIALLLCCIAGENGLTVSTYRNGALSGIPLNNYVLKTLNIHEKGVGSIQIFGTLTFPTKGWYNFTCHIEGTALAAVWVDGHMVCTDKKHYEDWQHAPQLLGNMDFPLRIGSKRSLAFRAHLFRNSSILDNTTTDFSMKWSSGSSTNFTEIPLSAMETQLSDVEQQREELQKKAQNGWGNWNQHSILDIVKLPEAAVLTTMLCNNNNNCITDTRIEPNRAGDCSVRVGAHSGNNSYVQFFFGNGSKVNSNVSVEYSSSPSGGLILVITPQVVEAGTRIRLSGRFAWWRSGTYATLSAHEMSFQGTGFEPFKLYTSGNAIINNGIIDLLLDNGPVVVSSKQMSVSTAVELIGEMRDQHSDFLKHEFKEFAAEALAIESAAMWNAIYVPLENGPIIPVSRNWNFEDGTTASTDFNYAMFDWDNLFASLLAGLTSKEIAYSNFIQTMKSKTADGFIPNFQAGGTKSQDRTEPPVGAKVLQDLYNRYGDKWIVELVFDDLLDWQNFFLRERLLKPLELVCLGSYNPIADQDHAGNKGNTMQDARFESGLDNSPMYDGEFFNTTSHQMMLYDVGMTSMVAQEAQSMSFLAGIIGRSEQEMLLNRSKHFSRLLSEHSWDTNLEIFSNKFPNGSFYERISPTSFYPLQVRTATDEQADSMVSNWLQNSKRFCISQTGDPSENEPNCYWGLPSIQASDPSYPPLGYWRGYIWGPMAQLTYWSLQQYNTPIVNSGRKAMARQLTSMMMSQWNSNRHICENYGPHKNTTDCTGTKFYHWGALTGLISIMEEGLW